MLIKKIILCTDERRWYIHNTYETGVGNIILQQVGTGGLNKVCCNKTKASLTSAKREGVGIGDIFVPYLCYVSLIGIGKGTAVRYSLLPHY